MTKYLIPVLLLLSGCQSSPKGIVCVVGWNGFNCHDAISGHSFVLPFPKQGDPGTVQAVNYISIPPEYLEELQLWAEKKCD